MEAGAGRSDPVQLFLETLLLLLLRLELGCILLIIDNVRHLQLLIVFLKVLLLLSLVGVVDHGGDAGRVESLWIQVLLHGVQLSLLLFPLVDVHFFQGFLPFPLGVCVAQLLSKSLPPAALMEVFLGLLHQVSVELSDFLS